MIIAIEGVDAAGKRSVTTSLVQHLAAIGKPTQLVSFPRYEGPVGDLIAKILKRPDLVFSSEATEDTRAKVLQALMLTDRLACLDALADTSKITVCDRYFMSGIVYGLVEGLNEPWLWNMHRVFPKASLQILLDVDPVAAASRRDIPRDNNEANIGKLKNIRQKYLEIWAEKSFYEPNGWIVIDAHQPKDTVINEVIAAYGSYCLAKQHKMNTYTEYP